MEIISETEEMEIFGSKCLQDLITFQWNTYARWIHYLGALVHLLYVVVFFLYVNYVYNHRDFELQEVYIIIMAVLLTYPMIYDMLQLCKSGPIDYFSEFWNYLDQCHIWLGYVNLIIQWNSDDDEIVKSL